jgi:curved DNA-binding protein CbpA
MSVAAPTYYRIFNVPPAASDEDIKKAFWRLSRDYHPDRSTSDLDRVNRERLIRELNEAYSTLKSPVERASYDRLLALRYTPCALCKGTGHRWGVGTDTHVPCRECAGAGWFVKS